MAISGIDAIGSNLPPLAAMFSPFVRAGTGVDKARGVESSGTESDSAAPAATGALFDRRSAIVSLMGKPEVGTPSTYGANGRLRTVTPTGSTSDESAERADAPSATGAPDEIEAAPAPLGDAAASE